MYRPRRVFMQRIVYNDRITILAFYDILRLYAEILGQYSLQVAGVHDYGLLHPYTSL